MKARKTAASRRTSGGGMLIGLFVGLVIGVLVAAGVVWYIHRTPMPFNNKVHAPPPPPPAQTAGGQPPAPMALPGKPGDPIPQSPQGDKPRFDFYKILPGNAEATPEAKKEADPKAAENKAKGEKDSPQKDGQLKEPVYLQTGSFQNAADADSHKARLALLGAEASVQQVMLQEKVWYRVRLGPFKKMDDVNNMRADLAKQGIDAKIVKKD